MKRVAITGLGTINSISKNVNEYKENLKNLKIGIDKITQFDTTDQKVKIAAEVKDFKASDYMDRKKAKRYDRYLQFAMVAANEAIEDSNLEKDGVWKENASVIIASGIGGFKTLYNEFHVMKEKGSKFVSPFLIPMMIADMGSGVVSIEHGIKGANFSTMSACASSIHAIIVSTMMIKHGYTEVAITGGSDACIDPMPIAAFANMTALSQRNDDPKTASRPFDKGRDGFVMAEGSGVLVLESEEHAKKRGAKIYGYVDGFGMTGDSYHISKSDPEGNGAARAMKQTLEMANISPEQVDVVSCHATSTPVGDFSEVLALRKVLGESLKNVTIQATKSLIGHGLGAAGVIELIGSLVLAEENLVHGMPNLFERDEEFIDLNIPHKTEERKIKTILKNSFGFGGHNASLLIVKE
jgi:3-oxoacyl-[acyl-carrier-protein] synthase II